MGRKDAELKVVFSIMMFIFVCIVCITMWFAIFGKHGIKPTIDNKWVTKTVTIYDIVPGNAVSHEIVTLTDGTILINLDNRGILKVGRSYVITIYDKSNISSIDKVIIK